MGLQLFSRKANHQRMKGDFSSSPPRVYLGGDYKLRGTGRTPSHNWFRLHPQEPVDIDLLTRESNIQTNLIKEIDVLMEANEPVSRD